jgi:hypothetical protein
MQRLCLEVFRQVLRLFKKHFSGAHVRHYYGLLISLNQARMRRMKKRAAAIPAGRETPVRGAAEKGVKKGSVPCIAALLVDRYCRGSFYSRRETKC